MYIHTAFLLLQATQKWVRHRVLLKVSVCVCVRARACMCVCVRVHLAICIYIDVYGYQCEHVHSFHFGQIISSPALGLDPLLS